MFRSNYCLHLPPRGPRITYLTNNNALAFNLNSSSMWAGHCNPLFHCLSQFIQQMSTQILQNTISSCIVPQMSLFTVVLICRQTTHNTATRGSMCTHHSKSINIECKGIDWVQLTQDRPQQL